MQVSQKAPGTKVSQARALEVRQGTQSTFWMTCSQGPDGAGHGRRRPQGTVLGNPVWRGAGGLGLWAAEREGRNPELPAPDSQGLHGSVGTHAGSPTPLPPVRSAACSSEPGFPGAPAAPRVSGWTSSSSSGGAWSLRLLLLRDAQSDCASRARGLRREQARHTPRRPARLWFRWRLGSCARLRATSSTITAGLTLRAQLRAGRKGRRGGLQVTERCLSQERTAPHRTRWEGVACRTHC